MNKNLNEERFRFHEIEVVDYQSYAIIDNEENKVLCHLLPQNSTEYCKDFGNKITSLLNEDLNAVNYTVRDYTCGKIYEFSTYKEAKEKYDAILEECKGGEIDVQLYKILHDENNINQ